MYLQGLVSIVKVWISVNVYYVKSYVPLHMSVSSACGRHTVPRKRLKPLLTGMHAGAFDINMNPVPPLAKDWILITMESYC
jgi:hypothetical protein